MEYVTYSFQFTITSYIYTTSLFAKVNRISFNVDLLRTLRNNTLHMESAIEKAKKTACVAIDTAAPELKEISGSIWSNPELGLEEKHAHKILTTFLEKHGFQVFLIYF
jgi:metal-dependent amidase/aminoacylase/carboxypeptidase family protein